VSKSVLTTGFTVSFAVSQRLFISDCRSTRSSRFRVRQHPMVGNKEAATVPELNCAEKPPPRSPGGSSSDRIVVIFGREQPATEFWRPRM
jgi:hypothetical protein